MRASNKYVIAAAVLAVIVQGITASLAFAQRAPARQGTRAPAAGAAGSYRAPRTADGRPDLSGIWQAINTAEWDIQAHDAKPGPLVVLGALGGIPAGLGVVEDGPLPYRPEALARKKENEANWLALDPTIKCFLPGLPRATYMPFPFEIVQSPQYVSFTYEFAFASRVVNIGMKSKAPVDSWMGWSSGSWDGDTLVVDVTGMVSVPGRTSVSRIRIDASGDRHFEFEDFGVCADYTPSPEALEMAAACRAAHIGLLPAAAPVRAWLASRGVLVSQDCGVTSGYENLDIAFCSQAAAKMPATAIAQAAVAGGARLAVVTCGADGSLAHDGRTWWRASAVPVEAVDTTGAGDSYAAAFLNAWLAGADVEQAMAAGSASAARTCTHTGAWPQDPLPSSQA